MAASKKTAKKAAKKATKKKATRSRTERSSRKTKKVTTKKASRRSRTRATTKEVKKSRVSGGSGRIAITDATKKTETARTKHEPKVQPPSVSQVQLAVLSPLRFPVQYEQLLAQTARVSGLTFVTLGALLLVANLHAFNGESFWNTQSTQTAATLDGMDSTMNTTLEEKEPSVDFQLPPEDIFTGAVTIEYVVSGADDIKVGAFYKEEERYISFGYPEQVDHDTYRYHWDTSRYPDGEYRLHAVVTNAYGTYEDRDSSYVTLDNMMDTTSESTINKTSEETTLSTDTTDTQTDQTTKPEAYIEVQTDHENGQATFTTVVPDAEEVRIMLANESAGYRNEVGRAYYIGNETWEYIWDVPKDMPEGEYTVYARIKNQHGSYESGHIETNRETFSDNTSTETTDSTTDTTAVTSDDTVRLSETDDPIETLVPNISLEVSDTTEMRSTEEIRIFVKDASFVELYAVPNFGLSPRFLGLARQHDVDEWRFRMDTTQTPNGDYELFARVKNSYGLYDSEPVFITIANDVEAEHTLAEKLHIEEVKSLEEETASAPTSTVSETKDPVVQERAELLSSESISTTTQKEELETVLQRFEDDVRELMGEYATAVRSGNTDVIARIEQEIQEIKSELIDELGTFAFSDELIEKINTHLSTIAETLKKRTERNEEIIRERVGETVFEDSDRDGISDYDEVNLYNTDPFSADSDNDGFIDGAEVAQGFDPTDGTPEALVAYESPREAGVVREDILEVTSITSLERDPDDSVSDGVESVAVISGKGLPNSYVTLYIFSTPIVVTVRTGDDGSWSYTFDKELPDGEHEVYAGVTDNAGRIVAKSRPLGFIKTAEAFTTVDAAATAETQSTETAAPSILSGNILLALASGGVVILGLILLLLGMHIHARRPQSNMLANEAT